MLKVDTYIKEKQHSIRTIANAVLLICRSMPRGFPNLSSTEISAVSKGVFP